MTVKTNGAEFKAFYADPLSWPGPDGETYHDDTQILVNGQAIEDIDVTALADTDNVAIVGGFIVSSDARIHGRALDAHFRAWKRRQTTTLITIECPAEKVDAIKAAVIAAGGKWRQS